MCKCLLVYGLIHSSLPYKQRKNLYTNKRSSIKATSNSKSRAIYIAAKCRMFTTRSLSSWVVLSSTTDLLILRHKIDYVTSLNVDFRRLYITRHRDLGTSITRIVCCLPTVSSNYHCGYCAVLWWRGIQDRGRKNIEQLLRTVWGYYFVLFSTPTYRSVAF